MMGIGEGVRRVGLSGVLVRGRLRSQVRRSQRVGPVWPRVIRFALFGAVCVAVLVYVGYLAGTRHTAGSGLGHALATTLAKPAVTVVAVFGILTLIAACGRRLVIEYLVRRPGPISVRNLGVPDGLADVDADRLSIMFRDRLARLRLQAPTPIPGATPSQSFLEMLDSEHLSATNPLGSLVAILRSALPTHAYEVSASLSVRAAGKSGGRQYGVTAQVSRLPNEAIPIDTAWATSCEDAVKLAADMVTAAILPLTTLSNRPPWSGWRRYVMHPLLVHYYERAEELTAECRYDEALDCCFSALKYDPKNVDIRLRQGFLQEKQRLFLDALATYAAARKVEDQTSPQLYHYRARRNRRASRRIASYRLAVLLAGPSLAEQWRKRGKITLRDRQREALRERLTPEVIELVRHYGLLAAHRGRRMLDEDTIRDLLTVSDDGSELTAARRAATDDEDAGRVLREEERNQLRLRDVLATLARCVLEDVAREVRHPWSHREWLTPLNVELTIAAVDLRHEWVKHRLVELAELAEPGEPGEPGAAAPPAAPPGSAAAATFAGSVVREWETRTDRWKQRSLTWTECYNAACLFALPLLIDPPQDTATSQGEDPPSPKSDVPVPHQSLAPLGHTAATGSASPSAADSEYRTALATRAVFWLSKAMSSATSVHVATRRDWVLSEDPDLVGLRTIAQFKHFETIYFPMPARTWARPRNVHRWEQSCYTNLLLEEAARRWESVWHRRRDELVDATDPEIILDWCAGETQAWELIRSFTRDYRHWRTRHALIEQMAEWGDRCGFAPLEVRVPRFDAQTQTDKDTLALQIMASEDRLISVHRALGSLDGQPPQLMRLEAELRDRDFWHQRPPRTFLVSVCDVHAALWQRLAEWVSEGEGDDGRRAFEAALAQARQLSSSSDRAWMRVALQRRFHPLMQNGLLPPMPHPQHGARAAVVPHRGNGSTRASNNYVNASEHS